MADENKVVEPKVETVAEGTPTEPVQLTAIEQRANEQGWVPLDEWAGDPDDWRPAKEFMDRAPLYKKIDVQNREIKELRRTMEEFGRHHNKLRETEYKRALADLKDRKKTALAEGDADAVVEIDEALAEARRMPVTPVTVPQGQAEENVVFQSWVVKNGWYENQPAMKAYADTYGKKLHQQGGMSPTELLRAVETEVKREFAHKFNNPLRDKPGAVDGGSPSAKSTSRGDKFVLNDEERRAMQRFVKQIPGMTEDKYIAELKKVKGVS
jgi:hypothetical protein